MLYVDVKFASILGSRLRNFKQKKDYLWNFSCPVCGDSSKNKLKARSFIYRKLNELFIKCHNCGYGTNLSNFIKYIDPILYDEYALDLYKSGENKYVPDEHKIVIETKPVELLEDDVLKSIKRIDTLKETHPAVKYLVKRQIPRKFWYLLYFTPKFKKYTNSIKKQFSNLDDDHPRMIIPLFTPAGKCFAFQGRAYDDNLQRYFTIKLDEIQEKIYGLERVDYGKKIYVVEGPLDSLFLPNCIAVSGASFDIPTIQSIKSNVVLIIDNEPRNKDIVKQLGKYIKNGYSVCIFPDTMDGKDINEMILSGNTKEDIIDVINKNTFSGIEAQLKFSEWKKV